MALVDSLMTAMVRADGDALVMHVGEKPIVVAGARTIDLSNHGLNLSAMVGMLGHLLPADAQATLGEFGAVEHALPPLGSDRFSVVAARGGDDIWIEIRRRRESLADSLTEEPAVPEDAAHHEREAAPAESGAAAEPAAPGDSDAVAESEVWAESAAPVEEPAAPTESVDAMAPVEEQVEPDADAARVAPLESTSPAEEPASSESVHTAEPVVPVDSVAPAEDPTARVESVAAAAPVAQGETDAVAESDVRAESGAPPEEPAAPAESVDAMAPVGAPVSPVEPDALSGSVTAASVPPAEEPAAPATSAPAVAPVEGLAVPVESDAVAARVAPLESASPAEEPASPESVRTAEPVGPVDGVSPAEDPVAPVESHQGAAARTAPARPDTVVAGDDQTPKAEASGADTVGDAEECEAQAGPLQHADEQPAGPSGVRVAAETPSTAAERPASTESDAPSEAAQPAPVVDAPAAADSESPAAAAVEGDVARTIDIESEEIEAVAAAVVEPQPVPALASAGARQRSEGELTPVMFNESTPASGSSAGEPPSPAAPFRGQSSVQTGDETPMTRTLRIEVPARTNPARASLDALLRVATAHDVSELFLISQSKMYIRAGGEIRPLSDESTLQAADVEALVAELTPEPWREAVHRGDPAEWNVELPGVGRMRCSSFRDHRGPGAVFRFAAAHVASAEQMGFGPDALLLATEPEGLVVIAGPAGSDRSAVVAAFVDTINRRRSDYVITVERQVRTRHENSHALISQREAGSDEARLVAAARAALRENPDVLVLEDVSSSGMAAVVLEAASQERFVIVSLEASSTAGAVQCLIDLLPEQDRASARATLSRVFRGAIAQLMVRKTAGGRIAARELLVATRPVLEAIADPTPRDLTAALEAGRAADAPSIAGVLASYVKDGAVDIREAFRKAPDQPRLLAALRNAGLDASTVERLA